MNIRVLLVYLFTEFFDEYKILVLNFEKLMSGYTLSNNWFRIWVILSEIYKENFLYKDLNSMINKITDLPHDILFISYYHTVM